MENFYDMYPEDKSERYEMIHTQLRGLLEKENHVIPNLSNTSALLNMALDQINWVGFYLMHGDELLLGPFQGKPACVHIPVGKGVCGTAVAEQSTQLVIDVNQFPGHIACDSASKSEIVVPIWFQGRIVGVLDIDSPILARFDAIDQEGLEQVVRILEEGCNWAELGL